jgi:hypothetical protein
MIRYHLRHIDAATGSIEACEELDAVDDQAAIILADLRDGQRGAELWHSERMVFRWNEPLPAD